MFPCHLVPWPSVDIHGKFYGDRPRGIPPLGELNATGVAKYNDFGLSITTPRSRALSTMLTVDDSTVTLLMLILSIWFLCPSCISAVLVHCHLLDFFNLFDSRLILMLLYDSLSLVISVFKGTVGGMVQEKGS